MSKAKIPIKEWFGKSEKVGDDLLQSFETDEDKMNAIWEITLMGYLFAGEDLSESRFPRSIASFERREC